jgi:hypothetical protein
MNREKSRLEMVVKKVQVTARKSRAARRTPLRRSDFEMQRNAEIGLFRPQSKFQVTGASRGAI